MSLRSAWSNGEHQDNQGYEERCYLKTPRINKLSIQFGKTEKKKKSRSKKEKGNNDRKKLNNSNLNRMFKKRRFIKPKDDFGKTKQGS